MRDAFIRRASAAALFVAAAAAQAQAPKTWPLDAATLPGAITGIPPGTGWPSPPLGLGPFMVESVRPEGNPPTKQLRSEVEFSRNVTRGDSSEKIEVQ